jgi:hypothetical protein
MLINITCFELLKLEEAFLSFKNLNTVQNSHTLFALIA